MKNKIKKWIRPALFTLGGALLGLGYYAYSIPTELKQFTGCEEQTWIR